jgi:hypothetical protein
MVSLTRANSTDSGAIRGSELTCSQPDRFVGHSAPGLGLRLQGLRVCHDVYLHSPSAWDCSAPGLRDPSDERAASRMTSSPSGRLAPSPAAGPVAADSSSSRSSAGAARTLSSLSTRHGPDAQRRRSWRVAAARAARCPVALAPVPGGQDRRPRARAGYSGPFGPCGGRPPRLTSAAGSLPEVTIGPGGAAGRGEGWVVSGTPLRG